MEYAGVNATNHRPTSGFCLEQPRYLGRYRVHWRCASQTDNVSAVVVIVYLAEYLTAGHLQQVGVQYADSVPGALTGGSDVE